MSILDELLGNGGCAFLKGKTRQVMPKRAEKALCVDAVMFIKAFILHGDERIADTIWQGIGGAGCGNGRRDLLTGSVIQAHIGGRSDKFIGVKADVGRDTEIIHECGEQRNQKKSCDDACYFKSAFHLMQYVR